MQTGGKGEGKFYATEGSAQTSENAISQLTITAQSDRPVLLQAGFVLREVR